MPGFRQILVGWDGSSDAAHAVRVAAELGEGLDAAVVTVAVLRPAHAECADEAEAEMRHRREEALAGLSAATRHRGGANRSRGIGVRYDLLEVERPGPGLDAYAEQLDADLIVVGRHGVDRAIHPRVGGVTEHLLRHSRRPVLVVGV